MSKARVAWMIAGAVVSLLGVVGDYPEEGNKFDKAKYVATQVSQLRHYLSERFGEDKLALDDSTKWHLLVSHPGRVPNTRLCKWFQTNPELRKLWTDGDVQAGYTGPDYTGWSTQKYSQYLTANGVVLMDGAGKPVFIGRGSTLPKTPEELVSQLSAAIRSYYESQGVKAIENEVAKYDASQDGSTENGGPIRWVWRNLVPKPWKWGKRPCPVCPTPDPVDSVAYTPPAIVDTYAEEGEPEEDFNLALIVVPALAGALVWFLKLRGDIQ